MKIVSPLKSLRENLKISAEKSAQYKRLEFFTSKCDTDKSATDFLYITGARTCLRHIILKTNVIPTEGGNKNYKNLFL